MRSCQLCPAAKYNPYSGQGNCKTCDEGKLSFVDRTACGDCAPGEYVFKLLECKSWQVVGWCVVAILPSNQSTTHTPDPPYPTLLAPVVPTRPARRLISVSTAQQAFAPS